MLITGRQTGDFRHNGVPIMRSHETSRVLSKLSLREFQGSLQVGAHDAEMRKTFRQAGVLCSSKAQTHTATRSDSGDEYALNF